MNTKAQNDAPDERPRTLTDTETPRGCAIPSRARNGSLFGGWGPRLMGLAFVVMAGAASAKSAGAATVANAPAACAAGVAGPARFGVPDGACTSSHTTYGMAIDAVL